VSFPTRFGQDVATTAAPSPLKAKWLYHAAIRAFRDRQSLAVCVIVIGYFSRILHFVDQSFTVTTICK